MCNYTHFSRVDARSITGVTLEGLEGVEVFTRAGSGGVPLVVNILLRIIVPKLVIVFTVFEVKLGGGTGVLGRHEGGGRCHKGDGEDLVHL